MPQFLGKNEYLYYVGAEDCIKNEVQWRHGFQLIQPKEPKEPTKPWKPRKKRNPRIKALGNLSAVQEVGKVTKVERKALHQEQKQVLKKFDTSSCEYFEEETEEELDIPSTFKSYTIQDRKIILQKPKH